MTVRRTLLAVLAGAALAVAFPRVRDGLARTTNTQVHRINQ
jgi:hypothetical protein